MNLTPPTDIDHHISSQGHVWVYGSATSKPGRARKVGIVSTTEHCTPHIKVLKEMGFKVKLLGGNPNNIPRSLHFVILRHESCSHGASDIALAWVRRSPETRTLAWANSVTGTREAARGYLDGFPANQKQADAADAARESEKTRKTPQPKRAVRKRPADFKPPEKPAMIPDTFLSPKQATQLSSYNVAAQTVYKMVESKQSIGCGIEDLRNQWKKDFGHEKSKSTIATILVKLKKTGFIRNIGAEGRISAGRQKAGWYVASIFHTEMKGPVLRAYNAYCKRISKKPFRLDPLPPKPTTQAEARSGFSPKKPPSKSVKEETLNAAPIPQPVQEPTSSRPYDSILEEAELLVMWMRDWNVDSITLSRTGEVEVSNEPTHSPKLEVRFTTAKAK